MIIICDNCGTRYEIAVGDIQEEGREVRCSKCNHVWLQTPFNNDDDFLDIEIDKANMNIANDYGTCKSCFAGWLKYSLIALLIMLSVSLFMIPRGSIDPALRSIYSVFGIYDSTELEFENAHYEYQEEKLLITSTIINNSNEDKVLPNMKISLYDGESNIMKTINLINHDKQIKSGEKKQLTQIINKVPEGTKYITLDIGNKLEMWFQ